MSFLHRRQGTERNCMKKFKFSLFLKKIIIIYVEGFSGRSGGRKFNFLPTLRSSFRQLMQYVKFYYENNPKKYKQTVLL